MEKSLNMSTGTGLKFEGYPTDEEKFFWILVQNGCNPKGVERILDRMKDKSYDLLTVQDTLHFDEIEEALKTVGVKMSFIEPQEDWYDKYNDPFPKDVIEEIEKYGGLDNNSRFKV